MIEYSQFLQQQFEIWKDLLKKERRFVVVLFLRKVQNQHNNNLNSYRGTKKNRIIRSNDRNQIESINLHGRGM